MCTVAYIYLGDNCIQIFHLGRYIVGYTVGNFVLWRRVIPPQMKNLNIVNPILMYFLTINIEKCFVFHEM